MQQRSGALACITHARSQDKHTIWACASGCAPPEGMRIITITTIIIVILDLNISLSIIIIISMRCAPTPPQCP